MVLHSVPFPITIIAKTVYQTERTDRIDPTKALLHLVSKFRQEHYRIGLRSCGPHVQSLLNLNSFTHHNTTPLITEQLQEKTDFNYRLAQSTSQNVNAVATYTVWLLFLSLVPNNFLTLVYSRNKAEQRSDNNELIVECCAFHWWRLKKQSDFAKPKSEVVTLFP